MFDSQSWRVSLKGLLSVRDGRRHAVWEAFYRRHRLTLAQYSDLIAPAYLEAFRGLNLPTEEAPSLEWLRARVRPLGWDLAPVRGYVSGDVIFGLLAQRRLPISEHIRSEQFLEHSPLPDFIHDMFGHYPFLFDAGYRRFAERFGQRFVQTAPCPKEDRLFSLQERLGTLVNVGAETRDIAAVRQEIDATNRAIDEDPSERSKLMKLYLWAVEFGFHSGGSGVPRVVGAGILSSKDEMAWAVMQKKLPLTKATLQTPYDFTNPQAQYFTLPDWRAAEDLLDSL